MFCLKKTQQGSSEEQPNTSPLEGLPQQTSCPTAATETQEPPAHNSYGET